MPAPRSACAVLAVFVAACAPESPPPQPAAALPVEHQPLAAATGRLIEALEYLGAPLPDEVRETLEGAAASTDELAAVAAIQRALDPFVLVQVDISPESRVRARAGAAPPRLVQQGWRTFLVKVHNEAGVTASLAATSPSAAPLFHTSDSSAEPPVHVPQGELAHRFLDLEVVDKPPLRDRLSGLAVEYAVLQVYTRDAGKREASLAFDVGQGTQDIGFRSEVPILFDCAPATEVILDVRDEDGSPATAGILVRDDLGRVYPAPARRLAPDFYFQHQVYRATGETLHLPAGEYEVEWSRGPEYLVARGRFEVPDAERTTWSLPLERWIHAAAEGWISGDHHVHAAGCSHYDSPAQGVRPEDMMRHLEGEDVGVGCVLSWGPCWYYQKEFFSGDVHELSTPDHVMRYDVEVSGFPSSHAGHLSLIQLTEDDYPGTTRIEEWPSWDLPVLQWAQAQGAVAGFSHSGWGLAVDDNRVPSYEMPRFDGIGANEFVVDVTHGAVDFISAIDTPIVWELSIWYHTLSCGYRARISGETDFPCIYGERVGLGRSYVHCGVGPVDYGTWAEGVRDGRSYVSDGRSHLLDFTVDGLRVGEAGAGGRPSEVALDGPRTVTVTARVAALLAEEPREDLRSRALDEKPYWHVERARVGGSRRVPVELIVNGAVVARQEVEADGEVRPVRFELPLERSSWVALRILYTSHTNPVFALVGGAPIRGDRRSAQWCLDAVDACWDSKRRGIRESEREAARAAYDFAAGEYARVLAECDG